MPASLKQNIILNNNSLQKMNAASDLRVCNLGFSSNFSAMTIIILMITFDVWSSEWYRFSPALLYSICDGMSFECVLCKTYRYLYFSSLLFASFTFAMTFSTTFDVGSVAWRCKLSWLYDRNCRTSLCYYCI